MRKAGTVFFIMVGKDSRIANMNGDSKIPKIISVVALLWMM